MAELVLAGIIIFLAWMVERGYRRGLVRTVFSVAMVLVSVLCATILGPMAGKWMKQNQTIYGIVEKQVDCVVGEQIEQNSGELNDTLTNKNIKSLMSDGQQMNVEWDKVTEQIQEWIEELPVPKKMEKELKQELKNIQNNEWEEKSIKDMVVDSITQSILQTIGYILVFVITGIFMRILFGVLIGMTRLPILHRANKLAGLAAGFVQGICIIWVAGIFIYMISSTQVGQSMLEIIYSNKILIWIYENNIFLLK